MSEIIKLTAEIRENVGTGPSRELRRNKKVPAIIYGAGNKPIAIAVAEKEMTRLYKKGAFITQQIEFDIAGKLYNVLPKEITFHPVTDIVRHLDFVFIEKKEQKMSVPLVYVNKNNSIGIKRGGFFNIVKRHINVIADVSKLPRTIEIDIQDMHIGDSLQAKDIILSEGIVLNEKDEAVVASMIGKKGRSEDEEDSVKTETKATAA